MLPVRRLFRVGLRAETPEALARVHSDHVLLIVDEASGVPEQVFEAAAGSMSGHSATTLMLSNPTRSSGTFLRVITVWQIVGGRALGVA